MGALLRGQTLVPRSTPPGSAREREAAAQADFKLVRVLDLAGVDVVYRLEGPGRYNYGPTDTLREDALLEAFEPVGP